VVINILWKHSRKTTQQNSVDNPNS